MEKQMKRLLSILTLLVALATLPACSAQKRAQRKIQRAVYECPELVQVKAHPIDTVITAPSFADVAVIPMEQILTGDTIYAATHHGTVVVSLCQSDSALRAGFVAAPQPIRYRDTLRYSQVVIPEQWPTEERKTNWWPLVTWLLGIALGGWIIVYLFKNTPIQNR